MRILDNLKKRVRDVKSETFALYLAARHPETPWYAKVLVGGVVAYAISPIDLIPDFVPILGYVDDLILVPLGIAVSIKMIPPHVMAECRARAQESIAGGKPVSRIAAAAIIGVWLFLAAVCTLWAYEAWRPTFNSKEDHGDAQPAVRADAPVQPFYMAGIDAARRST